MKLLKIIDATIQVIMLVFFIIKGFANEGYISDVLFPAYFIVGGYQFTSCMVQLPYERGRHATGARGVYQKMLIWLAVLGIATIPVFIFFLYVLLFISPLLAIFYTWLSVAETIKLLRPEIEHPDFSHE